MVRYKNLLVAIELFQPETIIEIGTWNGANAVRMLKQALKNRPDVAYIGYDLFEDASSETDKEEFNVKPHHSQEAVGNMIKGEVPEGASIILNKGNTRQTLSKIRGDFVFIDGGHSIETIQNDYEAVKDSQIIVFDDYYTPDESGRCPDITNMGCNKLLSGLKNYVLLPGRDPVSGGGYTQLAMVVNR